MWSRTFALFLRALRVDARVLPPHLMRLVLLTFVGVTLVYSQILGIIWSAPGLTFFIQITWINFCFASLAAAFLFASAITEEKEERTLGLLRMADVGPLPLLLGKSAPRLVAALLILFVQFPFALLAITLGGVTWGQVTAAFCTLMAHVVLIGGVALLFSVLVRRTGTAIALTFAVMAVLIIVFPFLLMTLAPPWGTGARPDLDDLPPVARFVLEFCLPVLIVIDRTSAVSRLDTILATGFDESPIGVQVLTNVGAGALLFLLAWLLFDPFNRNLDDEVRGPIRLARLIRRHRRSRRAWRLAITGKDFRDLAGGWSMLAVKLAAYLGVIALLLYVGNDFRWSAITLDDFGKGLYIMAFYFLLPIETTLLAARLFRTEVKDRTWPMLLSLPLSLPQVGYAKLAGALFALAPAASCFCLGIILDREDFAEVLGDMIENPELFVLIGVYVSYVLLLGHLTTCLSLLSNAWAGALLGIVTTVMAFFVNYMLAVIPIYILAVGGGGAGWGPNTVEAYLAVAGAFSTALVLVLAGCLHFAIGVRLKSAAAQ